ncbi:sensor histidine kinase [Tranquillimonas alkanivorans]|uniref:histidine kinase n=1 Tax=Tranquillimonas alkanivorans TaxID=441119 RepID=A0A1I5Q8Q6_9RHOB|nr:HAMP domain-containing sensor histidine kinase [Tranquillimonas alkanivorans]SFP42609.1 Signal transduction histidine kinase [Tranquillimonas alkanivorans]
MNGGFKVFRWTIVCTVLFALCLIAVGLVRLQSSLDEISETKRAGPMWIANQMEFELLRFTEALARFSGGSPEVTPDDLQFRFDILWSRHNLAETGQEGMPAAAGAPEAQVLDRLGDELRQQEDAVLSLSPGDAPEAARLYDIFAAYSEDVHEYTLAAKEEQAQMDFVARSDLISLSRVMVYLSVGMGLASLLLAVLFLAETRFHRRLAREKADLLEQAQEAYRAKSQFLATVSHELRTPVTSIKGTLGLMKGGLLGELPPKMARMVDIAHCNSDRLAAMINDILDFEKSESGELNYSFKPVTLASVVREAIEANRGFEARQGVTMTVPALDEDVQVEGDTFRLVQLVSNLLSNALKFSPRGERVEVTVDRTGDRARIVVRDFGSGISESFASKVFDRFTQEDSSNTRSVGGTGLGMSISKAIAERHNGRIFFESEVGKGTTFYVELPVLEAGRAQAATA